MQGTLRDRLKTATASRHAALDALSPLSQPAPTLESYISSLERLWGYYAQIEPVLAACGELQTLLGLPMAPRRKLQWLAADLCWLGHTAASVESLPRCGRVPHIESAAEALGCAYVLEGATLGGQFLCSRFHALWGLTERSGAQFMHGYGKRTASMWREFTAALNAVRLDREELAECETAACSTFETLTERLLLPSIGNYALCRADAPDLSRPAASAAPRVRPRSQP